MSFLLKSFNLIIVYYFIKKNQYYFLLQISEKLALLCINICRVVDPDIIIFGGGMAMAGNKLIDLIQHHISISMIIIYIL